MLVVKFFRNSFPYRGGRTLGDAIDAVLSREESHLRDMQVRVEVDVDDSTADFACRNGCEQALRSLVQLALSRCPQRGELQISACHTIRGVEIEIADSGSQSPPSKTNAFTRCKLDDLKESRPENAGVENTGWLDASFDVYCTRCPQGGLAWTLVVHSKVSMARAA